MIREISKEIEILKKEKNAIILAHNYQPSDIQEIADFTGDSFELAKIAKNTKADTIVFCGVSFMAESAFILNPDKTVLLPDTDAGCGLADMIDAESLKDFKEKHHAPAVTYINSSARTKAVSDITCTSSNCLKIIEKADNDTVIVSPDKNLAYYIQKNTRKKIIPWPGHCYVHNTLTQNAVLKEKEQHPDALILAHPECRKEVQDISDHIFSTSQMINFAKAYRGKELIICTERGILHPLKKINSHISYIFPDQGLLCYEMKLISLQKVRDALKYNQFIISVPEDIRKKAMRSLERMLEYGK